MKEHQIHCSYSHEMRDALHAFLLEKSVQVNKVAGILALCAALLLIGSIYELFNLWSVFACMALIVVIDVSYWLIAYRVKKGYYATNSSEAQKFIQWCSGKNFIDVRESIRPESIQSIMDYIDEGEPDLSVVKAELGELIHRRNGTYYKDSHDD
tara:strand:+ start:8448 stop:8909 length:462 start_codon:yes stop_codon:yes gene_type:complete